MNRFMCCICTIHRVIWVCKCQPGSTITKSPFNFYEKICGKSQVILSSGNMITCKRTDSDKVNAPLPDCGDMKGGCAILSVKKIGIRSDWD
jgi:hypothetical protein